MHTDVGFLLNGILYPNNSVVTLDDIGASLFMAALFCLTPNTECCSDSETPIAANTTREWYVPDGRPVSSAATAFTREQVSSAVSLYHSEGGTLDSTTGVFRCEIPNASGTTQNLYVGIYPQGVGKTLIIGMSYCYNSIILSQNIIL